MGIPKKDGRGLAVPDAGAGAGGKTASNISPAPSQSLAVRTCNGITVCNLIRRRVAYGGMKLHEGLGTEKRASAVGSFAAEQI
jgi:hypothetical protein